MKYKILDYRTSRAYGSMWTVDVKVQRTERFLWLFPIRKIYWMSCGKDGQPRFYNKIANLFVPENRLLVVESFNKAEQCIREFKHQQRCSEQLNKTA